MAYPNRRTLQSVSLMQVSEDLPVPWLLAGFAVQVPLAYAMHYSSEFATYYAVALLALGIWFVIHDQQPLRLICLSSYIVGFEVVWRMTKATIFWEYGKYAVGFLLLLALLKTRKRLSSIPLLYFFLLLPSVALTISDYPIRLSRQAISDNLSGPFLLMVAVLFFSQVKLSRKQLRQTFLFAVMPITALAFLATFSTVTAPGITFNSESNFTASGGYGPNQVSGLLGLGALLCWVLFSLESYPFRLRWLFICLLVWFLAQAFLTFSRGGVVSFFAAALCATFFLARGREYLLRNLIIAFVVSIFFASAVLPWLNDFTSGAMQDRYTKVNTTNRSEIFMADLQVWQDHFYLGVGPGNSCRAREGLGSIRDAPHTEFSRLLSEHGLLGFCALLLICLMFLKTFRQAPTTEAKGLVLAFMVWALVEMAHSAMRVAAISYFFSLPMLRLRR
jgi:hypothetical protein